MRPRPVAVAELLRIDYAAERAKLADAVFDAPWRGAAELVRRAVRAGAGRVRIRCGTDALVVADDGRPLDASLLAAFATCGDPKAAGAARHEALVRLETEPGLVAASLRASASIERVRGETCIAVPGCRLDADGRAALAEALRFCVAAVTLDGAPVPRGMGGAFAEGAAPPPLRGSIALGVTKTAEVALLLDSVVVARVSLASTPPLAAWIDGATLGGGAMATPARLREAIAEHVSRLSASAAELALSSPATLEEPACAARLEVLLACARLGVRRSDVMGTPALPALLDGRPLVRSLLELDQEAAAKGRSLTALDPSQDPSEVLLPAGTVYLMGAETRARIAALLDVRFRPVPSRAVEGGFAARLRRWVSASRTWLREALLQVRSPRRGRRLEEHELAPVERALQQALGPGVTLSAGTGPVRRAGREWRLPRHADLVRRAAVVLASDRRWRYIASLALFRAQRETPAAWASEWRAGASGKQREL
jgi:hypothetical protein